MCETEINDNTTEGAWKYFEDVMDLGYPILQYLPATKICTTEMAVQVHLFQCLGYVHPGT